MQSVWAQNRPHENTSDESASLFPIWDTPHSPHLTSVCGTPPRLVAVFVPVLQQEHYVAMLQQKHCVLYNCFLLPPPPPLAGRLTVVYVACKVDEAYVSADALGGGIKQDPQIVLSNELAVLQASSLPALDVLLQYVYCYSTCIVTVSILSDWLAMLQAPQTVLGLTQAPHTVARGCLRGDVCTCLREDAWEGTCSRPLHMYSTVAVRAGSGRWPHLLRGPHGHPGVCLGPGVRAVCACACGVLSACPWCTLGVSWLCAGRGVPWACVGRRLWTLTSSATGPTSPSRDSCTAGNRYGGWRQPGRDWRASLPCASCRGAPATGVQSPAMVYQLP